MNQDATLPWKSLDHAVLDLYQISRSLVFLSTFLPTSPLA